MARGKDLESYIKEATDNVRKDRAMTDFLLMELLKELKEKGNHQEYGLVAAKYLETLQRSNEQLVKLTTLIQKKTKGDEGLTSEDKQDLFDLINSQESS
jgi:hypothetical protein